MATDRELLIRRKLEASRQRLLRRRYLEALPGLLREELESARVLDGPEAATILRQSYISAAGVGHDRPVVPVGYVFREFSWPEHVFTALADYPDRHDGAPAFLQPFGARLSADLPLSDLTESPFAFEVNFGRSRRDLPALFAASGFGFALLAASFAAGIVVAEVLGSLPDDPNPHERVYELGTWG
jgi:hypothetical protein